MILNNILDNNTDYTVCNTFKDYKLYNYNKYLINNDNIDSLGLFRSIIFNGTKCVCVSPNKSYELNHFLKQNSEYCIEEFVDGIMINCFFDNDTWHISTYNLIDNKDTKELFINNFDTNNWEQMNKRYNYSFVFQHPSLPVINNKITKIYLIDIFDPSSAHSVKNNCLKNALKNIFFPLKINLSLHEAINKYCCVDSDYTMKGLVLVNNNKRTKIRNSAFEYYKYIHSNNYLSIIFEFSYMYKNKTLNMFVLKYGRETLTPIKKMYYNLTYNIYINYRNIYIRKTDNIDNYDGIKKKIILNLHNQYINNLMDKKEYITKKYVINYINELSSYELFIFISDIKLVYNRLNKLRI
jgi:hypothetical protein